MADFNFFLNSQGARGRKGEQGEQGFSPIITVYEQTATSYRLQIETLDGTFVTPNLLPAIQDAGGTVLQFDREQQQYFLGALPSATDETEGLVRMASEEDLNIVSETGAVTPIGVFTVAGKTIEAGTDNVHVDVDNENTKIIISVDKSSEYVLPVATTTTLGGIKPDNQTIITDPVTGETHANFDEIGNALNALSNKVNKIDEDVLALDGLLIDTQGDVEVLQDDVRGINVALNEIDGDIQGLDTRVTNLENKELPDNVFTADNLKNGTNVTFRKVGDETYIDAVGGGEPIDAYTKQETDDLLAARDTRITNVESEVTGIQTDVADLDEMVSDLTITVNNVSQEVTDVKGTVESHTESITTIQGNIADINNNKQNKLIAGENINIDPETNTISATGGGSEGKEDAFTAVEPIKKETVEKSNLYNVTITDTSLSMPAKGQAVYISGSTSKYIEYYNQTNGKVGTKDGSTYFNPASYIKVPFETGLVYAMPYVSTRANYSIMLGFTDKDDDFHPKYFLCIPTANSATSYAVMDGQPYSNGTYKGVYTSSSRQIYARFVNGANIKKQILHIQSNGLFTVGNGYSNYSSLSYYTIPDLTGIDTIMFVPAEKGNFDVTGFGKKYVEDISNITTPEALNELIASTEEWNINEATVIKYLKLDIDENTLTVTEEGKLTAIGGGADPDNVTIELNEEGKLQTTVDINALQNRVEDVETNKQDTLVSGTNIKTINGESLLGEGDIEIQGGGGGGASVINAVIKGSPTINGTQVSGFSNTNYLQLPFTLDMEGKNLDANFFFVTGNDVTTQQNVVDSKFGLAMAIKDGHGLIALGSTGESWDIGVEEGTLPIQPNTAYYGRLTHDGTAYKTELSTDGKVFNPDIEIQSTAALFPTPIYVGGYNESATHAFEGIIDMAKCNVKLNNMEYWNGIINDYESLSNLPTISQYPLKGDLGLVAPLRIEKTSTDALYNASYGTNKVITWNAVGASLTRTGIYVSAGNRVNKEGELRMDAFVKFPYSLGDVVFHGHGNTNTSDSARQNALLGYTTESGAFRPVIRIGKDYTNNYYILILGDIIQWYSNNYYSTVSTTRADFVPSIDASYTDTTTYLELKYGNITQLVYDNNLGVYKAYYKTAVASGVTGIYTFDTKYNDLLQKIDTVCFYSCFSNVDTGATYSQCWVKQYSNDNNVFNSITYPQLKALPDVEIPEVDEHNRLTCGDINNSYALLEDKPKLGGVTIEGNLNPDGLNLQRLLSPTNGLEIKQTGEWNLINGSYDETTKQITFNSYNYNGSSSNIGYFYPLSDIKSIGTYVDKTKLIPKAGMITPFYTNVTWKFGWANSRCYNALVFGEYDGTYFTPKYIFRPLNNNSVDKSYIFAQINEINASSTTVFKTSSSYGTFTSTSSIYPNHPICICYLTVLFDGTNYTMKTGYRNGSSASYKCQLTSDDNLRTLLNSCNSVWYIPNSEKFGLGANGQIYKGDISEDAYLGIVGDSKDINEVILPDTEGNILHTSIGVKTDNDTIQLNTQGQLSVPALGGMKLVKLTDEEYTALETKDVNTLYVVTSTDAVHIYLGEIQIA